MIHIHVGMTGDKKIQAKIDGWVKGMRDLRPVYKAFARDLAAFLAAQFPSEGVLGGGGKWAPLNPKYKAQKIAEGGAPNILVRTGRLLADATNPRKLLRRAGPHRATYAIVTPYYRYLHTGTRKMPARQLLRKSPLLQAALRRRVLEQVKHKQRRSR